MKMHSDGRPVLGLTTLTGLLIAVGVGCGGAVTSGMAVGRVGQQLAIHGQGAPQGATVCALGEAHSAPPQGSDKPLSSACGKAMKSDQLWRRAMLVLGAYGESLEAMSAGGKTAGQVESASTGVKGTDWPDVEDSGEKGARDAIAQLVTQMNTNNSKGDPAKAVQESAPQVKTICDGLTAYLETQAKNLGEALKEMEKKRASKTERRCGAIDNKTLCVSETSVDRAVYATAFGQVTQLENAHVDAFNAASGFCAAHKKLEEAAAGGKISKDTTQGEIAEAVRSARRLQPSAPPAGDSASAPKK